MEKKQTAVEWFAYNDAQATLDYAEGRSTELVFAVKKMAILQQALQMERQQIIDAYNSGQQKEAKQEFWTKGTQYFEETYGEKTRP